jgi:hypothetical protein
VNEYSTKNGDNDTGTNRTDLNKATKQESPKYNASHFLKSDGYFLKKINKDF